jgi:hypothetical protein
VEFKREIEEKFAISTMNRNFRFPRILSKDPSSKVKIGTTATKSVQRKKPNFLFNPIIAVGNSIQKHSENRQ